MCTKGRERIKDIDWTKKLKEDLKRINKTIKVERTRVEKGIKNLELLQRERERILDECLGGCDG
jgi:hypothetical protein